MEEKRKITIRKALPSEAEQIAGFQMLMADESEGMKLDHNTVLKGVRAVFRDPEKGFYLVACFGEELVACLMVTLEWSDWRAQTVYWIQSLYVVPESRRQGVFKSMYAYLKEQVADNKDVAGIRLYVDIGNLTAQKAYEALGMNGEHYRLYEDI